MQSLKKELNPVCFCDNNQSLWGKNVEGIVVKSPLTRKRYVLSR